MNVVFTSHRVEFIEEFEKEAVKYNVIILEEPPNELLFSYFEGKIPKNEYLDKIDTTFPKYNSLYLELLKKLYLEGIKILQIEPYLEKLNEIYRLIENGVVGGDDRVRRMEKKATKAWIEYQEAFIKKDFDELVEKTIKFARVDAERFVIRDEMRAEKIAEVVDSINSEVLIEAGQIHILLPSMLEDYGFNVSTKSIPSEVAKKLGYNWTFNPGSELTIKYMIGEEVSKSYEKVTAARALVYISMISKEEMLPSDEQKYPHLIDELKITNFVNSLDYERCKKIFEKIWL